MAKRYVVWIPLILLLTVIVLGEEKARVDYASESLQVKPALAFVQSRRIYQGCPWGDWTRCPEAYGVDPTDRSVKRLAILVSGQLSRLELRSKLHNVVDANKGEFELYAVLLLSRGATKSSNYYNRVDGPIKMEEWTSAEAMRGYLSELFGNITDVYRSRAFHDSALTRQVFYFSVLDSEGRHKLRVAFGLTQDEPQGQFLLNPNFSVPVRETTKQTNQQDMFRNMRKTMILLEDIEVRMRCMMDLVLRIREDAFVLRPWQLKHDPLWSDRVFVTPNCWKAGGFSDSSFLMGRGIASKVMRGLAEEYYLGLAAHYRNPERYIRELVVRNHGQVVWRHVCEWPVLPIIFRMKHFRLHMDLRYQSNMDATRACGAAEYNSSCVFKDVKSVRDRKKWPYYSKRFITWQ